MRKQRKSSSLNIVPLHLLKILNSLPHATLAINKQNVVVAVNDAAKQLFGAEENNAVDVSFGSLLYCHNALGKGVCGTGIMCRTCSANDLFKLVFENKQLYNNQIAIVRTQKNGESSLWRVWLSMGHADYFGDEFAIATITNAVLEEDSGALSKTRSDGVNNSLPDAGTNPDASDWSFAKIDALLNSLFPNVDEGLIVVDANGRVGGFNHKVSKLLGHELEVGDNPLNLWDLVETNDIIDSQFRVHNVVMERRDKPYTFEGAIITGSGTRVPASFTLAPLSDYLNRSQGWVIIVKDLSVEESLRAQALMHNFAIENAPSDYIFCDSHGFVSYANLQARSSFGWDVGNYKFANVSQIFTSSRAMKWNRLIRSIVKRGAVQLETTHQNRLGEAYPVMASVYMIKGKPQNSLCYIAYNNSVQKQTQERLLKEAKINQNMAEISTLLSNVDRFKTVSLLVRQYALEITESQFCFLAYRNPMDNALVTSIYSDSNYSYRNEVELLEKHFRYCYVKSKSDGQECRFANQNLDSYLVEGKPITQLLPFDRMAWSAIEIENEYKGILFVAGKKSDYAASDSQTLSNLTTLLGIAINRIQENIVIKNTNDKLLMAMDVANLGTFEWDMEKRTVEVSQRWLDLLGYGSHSTNVGIAEIVRLVHPEDIRTCFRNFILHFSGRVPQFRFVSRIKSAKGHYLWIQNIGQVVSHLQGGNPAKIISVHFDITEQMALNQQLVKAKEEAVSASKAKSVFIARMSHELRTPLNAITGFSDLLKNNTSDAMQLGYLNSIKKSGMALLDLVNDLLDFSKMEVGKLSLRPSEVDVIQLVREIISMFRAPADEKFLQLKLSLRGQTPQNRIWIDDTRLRQVLSNLIGNAIKFTEKGYVEVVVETSLNPDATISLAFSVIDTGIGIKPESQLTIFDDFVQQDGQDNRRYGGTGLGLGIVKRLVELMEGTISLTSQTGVGSHFRVDLPLCKTAPIEGERVMTEWEDKDAGKEETMSSREGIIDLQLPNSVKAECQQALANLWPSFRDTPSFSKIVPVAEQLVELGTRLKVSELIVYANRLQTCYHDFNVEDLKKCIADIEKFADLYELA